MNFAYCIEGLEETVPVEWSNKYLGKKKSWEVKWEFS